MDILPKQVGQTVSTPIVAQQTANVIAPPAGKFITKLFPVILTAYILYE